MFSILATLAVFLITLIMVYDWQKHSYWRSKGVPTPTYLPLIGHTYIALVGLHWENVAKMYKKFKYNGFWGTYEGFTPTCFINDPNHIREILVKEADHFIDRRPFSFGGESIIFNEMLSLSKGEKWKSLRSLMSPTFTSGKIKGMFPLVDHKVKELMKQCEKDMDEKSFVEINSLLRYYTMDVIGTCAFGIDVHCLQQRNKSQFIQRGNSLTYFGVVKLLKFILSNVCPVLFKAFGFSSDNDLDIRFFSKVVEETVAVRRKSGVRRGDFLDLMLDALDESQRKGTEFKYPMTMKTVVAQSILFLLAGFDPTSTALAFVAYLLSKNPEAQSRLRRELQKVVDADGELNYQNIMEAPYLDACLAEALRVYSPTYFSERCCTKKFTLPGTDVEIPENMIVIIPVFSLHRDPDYWEEPLAFLPDRFLPENKANVRPYTYLPFGHGPRNCIGMRFAQMEVKLAIARLCLNFEMELRPGFTELVMEKTVGSLRPNQEGVQLVMKKINKPVTE